MECRFFKACSWRNPPHNRTSNSACLSSPFPSLSPSSSLSPSLSCFSFLLLLFLALIIFLSPALPSPLFLFLYLFLFSLIKLNLQKIWISCPLNHQPLQRLWRHMVLPSSSLSHCPSLSFLSFPSFSRSSLTPHESLWCIGTSSNNDINNW